VAVEGEQDEHEVSEDSLLAAEVEAGLDAWRFLAVGGWLLSLALLRFGGQESYLHEPEC
jgi:hypothetical protein